MNKIFEWVMGGVFFLLSLSIVIMPITIIVAQTIPNPPPSSVKCPICGREASLKMIHNPYRAAYSTDDSPVHFVRLRKHDFFNYWFIDETY